LTEKYDPQRAPTPRRSIAGGPKPPVYRRICQIADLPPDALQDPQTNLITLLKLLLDKGRTVPKSICLCFVFDIYCVAISAENNNTDNEIRTQPASSFKP